MTDLSHPLLSGVDPGDEQEEAPKTPVYCRTCGAELAHEFDVCDRCDADEQC